MYCIRIAQNAEKLRLDKLLTLTLDPAKLNGKESTRYINAVFAAFRVYLIRRLGYAPAYIRILEYQKNGNAHLHVLVGCYLPQDWVSEVWSAIGGGRIVHIQRVEMRRVSRYLSKYLSKDMIKCAPKGTRRVTTSKGIRLLANEPSDFDWRLIRIPILRLLDVCRGHVIRIVPDTDGYLLEFETRECAPFEPPCPSSRRCEETELSLLDPRGCPIGLGIQSDQTFNPSRYSIRSEIRSDRNSIRHRVQPEQ